MRTARIALLVCGLAVAAGAVSLETSPVGSWRPVRPEPGFVQQAYTGQPAMKDTGFRVIWLAAGPDGTLYVNQDRASRGPGDERSTPDATEIVVLRPDGSAGVLQEPIVDGLQVEEAYILAVGNDGTAYLHDEKNGRLVARAPDRTWRAMTAAQHWSRHDGDGGPALQAHIEHPGAAAVGPDGSVFVSEPFAVRRIAPDGIITTVAGTNAFDEENVSHWGEGRILRPAPAQVGPEVAGALEQSRLSSAFNAEVELRPQRAPKPATGTVLPRVTGMNVLPDGSLVLVFHQNIRIVRPDGLMEVVAGPNDGRATDAGRILPHILNEEGWSPDGTTLDGAAVGHDGAVYTKDTATGRVLRWRAAEGLSLVAGSPRFSPTGDPTVEEKPASKGPMVPGEVPLPADRVSLNDTPAFLAFLPSGDLAMAELDQVVVLGDPAALPGW